MKYYNRTLAQQVERHTLSMEVIGAIIRKEKFKWLNDDGTIDESKTQIK